MESPPESINNLNLDGVRGVLCDLDHTLYDYDSTHAIALKACILFAAEKYALSEETIMEAWQQARKLVHHQLHGQAASHSRLLYAQLTGELLFGKTNAEFALALEDMYWSVFLNEMKWFPEMELWMKVLNERQIPICIVTDLTAQIQLKKWQQLGLDRYCNWMLSSEEAGMEKPGAAMFELALNKLGLDASEVIMVGDSASKDIAGAQALGIRAIQVSPNGKLKKG